MSAAQSHSGEDVAAYALGALDPAEAERMRRHLVTCPVCLDELGAFQQVVDDLAASPERLTAPPALRRQVMRGIAGEPRLDGAHRERRRSRSMISLPRISPALAGGLAVVVVALLVAGTVMLTSGGGRGSRTVDAQVIGRGSAALHVSGGHGELVVHRFPSPPRGKIYEVWLKRGTGRLLPTTALFGVTGRGDGDVVVPGSLRGVTRVLVTPEPVGGSRHPTHPPVITVGL